MRCRSLTHATVQTAVFLICAAAAATLPETAEVISDGLEAFNWVDPTGHAANCFYRDASANVESAAGRSDVYFVVLDAGSTGTRAVAHRFRRSDTNRLGLDHLGFSRHRRRPGLSAFGRFPGRCRGQLESLLAEVASAVPRTRRASTCLLLRATAGFRLMDARARHLVVREVRATLLRSEFLSLGLESVRMLEGSEEAKYTWLSVNYLLGKFRGDATMSGPLETKPVIEMGGGSLQIAYESADGDQALAALVGRRSPGAKLRLRARSYLGLGIRESILRFVGHDSLDGDGSNLTSYQTACLAENLTLDFTFGPVKVQLVGRSPAAAATRTAPTANSDCITRALNLTARIGVREELALVADPRNSPVYAISGVYHLLEFLHREQSRLQGFRVNFSASACSGREWERCKAYATTVGEVTRAAYAVCRDIPRDGNFKPYYCINLAVTAALLQSGGMGLPDVTPLVALGGQEALGWTLGISLEYLRAAVEANAAAAVARLSGLAFICQCSLTVALTSLLRL